MSLITTQIISAILLFAATLICGILPAWVGKKLLNRSSSYQVISVADDDQPPPHNHNHSPHFNCDVSAEQDEPTPVQVTKPVTRSRRYGSKKSNETGRKILSFLMNLGGGVLLATSFLHMLPEVRESFEKTAVEPPTTTNASLNDTTLKHGDHGEEHSHGESTIFNLPLTELLVCTGFFLIFLAEEVVHLLLTNHNGLLKSLHDTCEEKKQNYMPNNRHNHSTPYSKYGSTSSGSSKVDDSEITHLLNESDDVPPADTSVHSMPIFRCIMIIFALSFHSIFDGVAIGLQSTPGHLIQLILAIAMHKLLIAFVVGLQIFSETKSLKSVAMYMLPFSLMSPVALVVTAQAKIVFSDFMTGALTAISTGSLLYITFYEILLREKQSARISGLMQFVATVSGFALMALLQSFTEHHH